MLLPELCARGGQKWGHTLGVRLSCFILVGGRLLLEVRPAGTRAGRARRSAGALYNKCATNAKKRRNRERRNRNHVPLHPTAPPLCRSVTPRDASKIRVTLTPAARPGRPATTRPPDERAMERAARTRLELCRNAFRATARPPFCHPTRMARDGAEGIRHCAMSDEAPQTLPVPTRPSHA